MSKLKMNRLDEYSIVELVRHVFYMGYVLAKEDIKNGHYDVDLSSSHAPSVRSVKEVISELEWRASDE